MITLPDFKSKAHFLDYFKDEQTCKDYLEHQRWEGSPSCPKCLYTKVYRYSHGYQCANRCCRKKFSVTLGTIMESTKLPLRTWFEAIYLLTSHKKGYSSVKMADELGVTQKTAWFLDHRIREMLEEKEPVQLTGEVQIDETYVGGKRQNMHGKRRKEMREKYGTTGSAEKLPVFGMLDNNGKLFTTHIEKTEGDVVKPLIRKHIDPNAAIVTDQHGAYAGLAKEFPNHYVVYHNRKNYVTDSGHHTNSIESVWATFKRGYIGVYHYMSPKHLNRYCQEFAYRFNTKALSTSNRFHNAMLRTDGRLKYKDLIAA